MTESRTRAAVFLDRDGTLNVEKNYLISPADFEFIDGVPAALKQLQAAGFLLVVISNQSGVARGYFTLEQVAQLHDHMQELLAKSGVSLAGVYVCPHHPTAGIDEYRRDCDCRKGKPGLLFQAAAELDIDLRRSYMIGDKLADIEAGAAAGCQTFLVRTGFGANYALPAAASGAEVVADLPAAVRKLLALESFN